MGSARRPANWKRANSWKPTRAVLCGDEDIHYFLQQRHHLCMEGSCGKQWSDFGSHLMRLQWSRQLKAKKTGWKSELKDEKLNERAKHYRMWVSALISLPRNSEFLAGMWQTGRREGSFQLLFMLWESPPKQQSCSDELCTLLCSLRSLHKNDFTDLSSFLMQRVTSSGGKQAVQFSFSPEHSN